MHRIVYSPGLFVLVVASALLPACGGAASTHSSRSETTPLRSYARIPPSVPIAPRVGHAPGPIQLPWPARPLRPGVSQSLVIREIQLLETALPQQSRASPKLAAILRRLSTNYAELAEIEAAKARDADVEIEEARRTGADGSDAGSKREHARKTRDAARRKTTEYDRRLVDEFPDEPKLDQVHFFIARDAAVAAEELESSGEPTGKVGAKHDDALKAYVELTELYPSSTYVAWAYAAYGDLLFDDARRGTVTWEVAREALVQVVAHAGEAASVTHAHAQLMLAFGEWNAGHVAKAREQFSAAKIESKSLSDARVAQQIAKEVDAALAEMD